MSSSQIEILINGERRSVPRGWTVSDLVSSLEMARGPVAVELNEAIVRKQSWETARLSSGDQLEIVHFVGGG